MKTYAKLLIAKNQNQIWNLENRYFSVHFHHSCLNWCYPRCLRVERRQWRAPWKSLTHPSIGTRWPTSPPGPFGGQPPAGWGRGMVRNSSMSSGGVSGSGTKPQKRRSCPYRSCAIGQTSSRRGQWSCYMNFILQNVSVNFYRFFFLLSC